MNCLSPSRTSSLSRAGLWLLACLLAPGWVPAAGAVAPKISLSGKSFSLNVGVDIIDQQNRSLHYDLEELHSAWQLRSKVRYRTSPVVTSGGMLPRRASESGTLFADHQQLLIMVERYRFCEALEADFVDRLLTGGLLKNFNYENHLIATGRLLHFIDENRNSFEEAKMSSEDPLDEVLVRSELTKFSAKLKADSAEFEVELFYSHLASRSSNSSDDTSRDGVPQMITIRRLGNLADHLQLGRWFRFSLRRFFELRPAGYPIYGAQGVASSGSGSTVSSGAPAQAQPLAFDLMAIERASGCARVLNEFKLDWMDLAREEPHGFMLRARMDLKLAKEPTWLTVGYEPSLLTLQVQRESATRTGDLTTNFKQNRRYFSIRRRGDEQDLVLDKILDLSKRNSELDASGESSSSCVVTQVRPMPPPPEGPTCPHTQGGLVLGATRLTYLGMALVRGIETNVFEADDSQLPVWLQAPSVYEDSSSGGPTNGTASKLKWRTDWLEGDKPEGEKSVKLTSVFYFSRAGRSSNRLVLIEIFRSRADARARDAPDRISIPIYDFAWRFGSQALAPNGMRFEDFYSLRDSSCLAPASAGGNQYARLELLLELVQVAAGSGDNAPRWVLEPGKRNLAIMKMLQEQLGVPSHILFELESRYDHNPEQWQLKELPVTLWAAQRVKSLAKLRLLAKNQLLRVEKRVQFKMFQVFSFQTCYLYCAQRRVTTLFLFDPIRLRCLLYLHELPEAGVSAGLLIDSLLFPPAEPAGGGGLRDDQLEVYEIVHEPQAVDEGSSSSSSSPDANDFSALERVHEQLASQKNVYLVDPSYPPTRSLDWQPDRTYFRLKRFDLSLVDRKSSFQLDGKRLEDSNKLLGYGLVLGDPHTKQVLPRWTRDAATDEQRFSQSQMTFEDCATACLVDPNCSAFSTCARRHGHFDESPSQQLECLLTSVDFKSPALIAQLMLYEQKAKLWPIGSAMNLSIAAAAGDASATGSESSRDSDVVRVVKSPTCELHSKSYRDLFRDSGRVSMGLEGRVLVPVAHVEQCARLCFTSTWDFLRPEGGNPSGGSSKMERLIERRVGSPAEWVRDFRAHICDHFLYLDFIYLKDLDGDQYGGGRRSSSSSWSSSLERLKGQISGANHEGPTRGYCILHGNSAPPPSASGGSNSSSASPAGSGARYAIEVQRFEFDFLELYERTANLSLAESRRTEEEKLAYYGASFGQRQLSSDEVRTLNAYLARNENSGQARPRAEPADCARECFQQLTGGSPWPACRSFDFMEIWHASRGKRHSFCLFNSATLRQLEAAQRFDLVRRGEGQNRVAVLASEEVRVWHFEPKAALASGSLEEAFRVGSGNDESPSGQAPIRLGPLGLLLVVGLVFATGQALGVNLAAGGHLRAWLAGRGGADGEALVEEEERPARSRPRVVFENIHHGQPS